MENTRKWIGLKDVILVTLLTALCLVIFSLVVLPFSANLQLVLWVVPFLDMLLGGPIYMLIVSKAPRHGTQLLCSFLFAVYYFTTNGMVVIFAIIFAVGIVQELLMIKGGYRSPVRLTAAYALFGLGVVYAPIIVILMSKEAMIQAVLANGLTREYAESIFSVYSAGNIAIATALSIVGAALGCFIGYRMLKKHFAPAGIVEES